jgi:hypothetical protein
MTGRIDIQSNSRSLILNEAIFAFSIIEVLKHCKSLPVSKVTLIPAFLQSKITVNNLKRANSRIRSIEELISFSPFIVTGFNNRYIDTLSITTNAITILLDSNILQLDNQNLKYNPESKFELSPNFSQGKNIVKSSEKLANILLNENNYELFLKLRIRL